MFPHHLSKYPSFPLQAPNRCGSNLGFSHEKKLGLSLSSPNLMAPTLGKTGPTMDYITPTYYLARPRYSTNKVIPDIEDKPYIHILLGY